MSEDIITRDSSEFKELRRNIIRAIQAVDILRLISQNGC